VALYDLPNKQNLAAFSPAMKRRQRAAETHFELLEIDIKTQGRPFAPAIAFSQSAAGFRAQNQTRGVLFRAGAWWFCRALLSDLNFVDSPFTPGGFYEKSHQAAQAQPAAAHSQHGRCGLAGAHR
jgi:hypothetical protein